MGYVYVLDFRDMVKVGYTTDLKTRITSIQCTIKKKARDVFSIPAPIEVESLAHKELEPFRIHGEYYNCSFVTACNAVESAERTTKAQPAEVSTSKKVKFTMIMAQDMAQKLDYIGEYFGRSRIKEIEWACKQYIKDFEKKVGEIGKEDT